MNCFQIDDWYFEVDTVLTDQFYKKVPMSSISKKYPESLNLFFEMLAIDLNKPYEICSNGSECIFVIFGSATSDTGFELEFRDEDTWVYVIVYPYDDCGIKELGPAFSIGIPNYKAIFSD